MENTKAVEEFIGVIEEIKDAIGTLSQKVDDHLGYTPEVINYAHVGTASKVLLDLRDIMSFIDY